MNDMYLYVDGRKQCVKINNMKNGFTNIVPGVLQVVHKIGAKFVLNQEQNMLCTNSYQIFCIKRIPMLTDLKM